MTQKLMSKEDVMSYLQIGKTTLYKLMLEDDFPQPLKIGKLSRWNADKVTAWVHNKELSQQINYGQGCGQKTQSQPQTA